MENNDTALNQDEVNKDRHLTEPFDISMEPLCMSTSEHPSQNTALHAAMLTLDTNGNNKFDAQRICQRKAEQLTNIYDYANQNDALPKMVQRSSLRWRNSSYVVSSASNEIDWNVTEFFVDLLICRGRDTGLAAICANVGIHQNIEFKLELKWSPRTFSAKFAHLDFDPVGAIQYIGHTYRSEDAWIAWIPHEAVGVLPENHEAMAAGTCTGDTRLSRRHHNTSFMYFANELHKLAHRDIVVMEKYPDIDDQEAVRRATNLWDRNVNLTLPQLNAFHNRMSHSYDEWISAAPDSYKADGFFLSRTPVAITSRYGQNQQFGYSSQDADVEDRNWDEDRPWDEISHVTVAFATHVRAKKASSWRTLDIDEMFPEGDPERVVYDSHDPANRAAITWEELEELPIISDGNEEEIRIYNEAGFVIPRRIARFNRDALPYGGLIDFSRIHEMFSPPFDDDDQDMSPQSSFKVYPQAGLVSCGHVVSDSLMYPYGQLVDKINNSLIELIDNGNDIDIDWTHSLRPPVFGISSQIYNSLMHNTRGNSSQHHGVVLGKVTAALAGYWARDSQKSGTRDEFRHACDAQLPHEEYLRKITDRPVSRDLRVENVIGISMDAVHPSKRTGRVLLNEILLPMANHLQHPVLFEDFKQHIVLFKPEAYPMIYARSTIAITQLLKHIYKLESSNMDNGKTVNPLNVELCAILERALNYMHSGNTSVIATTVMNAVWIGKSIIVDGLPSINPLFVRYIAKKWEVVGNRIPLLTSTGLPNSVAQRVITYNYGEVIYNRYLAHLSMTLASCQALNALTRGLTEQESSIKAIIYHAILIFLNDITNLICTHVRAQIKPLLADIDKTISQHARTRLNSLSDWSKAKHPLSWENKAGSSGNYALLSVLLCEDPNIANPLLNHTKDSVTYESLIQILTSFATNSIKNRPAPLTKNGGFQHVVSIAHRMVTKLLITSGNDVLLWNKYLVDMFKAMKIELIPWHKDSPNAYATDLRFWAVLRQTRGLPAAKVLTFQERVQVAAENAALNDPHAPWQIPERLRDMKKLWEKRVLPTDWDLRHASLPSASKRGSEYLQGTYEYVSQNYNGSNWKHHLALIVAICFSRVVPDICLDTHSTVSSSDPVSVTEEIRDLEWISAPSASHKGTGAPRPFIVMMSTALIGFWDEKTPFASHLRSNGSVLGKVWSDKHGPKQIHALNFIRMGLAIGKSSGVRKNAKLNSNWCFKPDKDLKSLYTLLLGFLTSHKFGEYLSIRCLFGETIARKLAAASEYLAPPA